MIQPKDSCGVMCLVKLRNTVVWETLLFISNIMERDFEA